MDIYIALYVNEERARACIHASACSDCVKYEYEYAKSSDACACTLFV